MKRKTLIGFVALVLIAGACNKEDDKSPAGNARLSVRLTDLPASYDAVNVEIQQVGAHVGNTWYDFDIINPGVYDLLELSNGNTVLLIRDTLVPAGRMTEMRLILGDENTIVENGETYDLKIPSGQSSGYKVKINQDLAGDITYQVIMDFDATKSVVDNGNGNFLLKPVVHAYLVDAVGQISGNIDPVDGGSYVEAFNSTDTSGTNIDNNDGSFLLSTVLAGTYTVKIYANEGYQDKIIPDIQVEAGNLTVMGVITIDPE